MCFLTKCYSCNKITWSGCGRHLSNLVKQVPENERCQCKPWV